MPMNSRQLESFFFRPAPASADQLSELRERVHLPNSAPLQALKRRFGLTGQASLRSTGGEFL